MGGPFWIPKLYNTERNKDFFFLSGEFRREIRGAILTSTVPTLRQRQGILDPNCTATQGPCTKQSADPQENVVNEANVTGPFDSNATAFLNRFPLPNTSYAANGFNFINGSPLRTIPNDHWAFRWDHNISDKATVMVNFIKRNTSQLERNTGWGDDAFPNVASDWFTSGKVATVKIVNTINPHTVNDFQFGYSNNTIIFQTSKNSDPTLASRSGFTFTELFPQTSGSFPAASFNDGFGSLLHTAPFFNRTDNFQISDNISKIFGRHNLKVGFTTRFSRKREPANGGDDEGAGAFVFDSLGAMLVGNASQYTEEQSLNEVPTRAKDIAVYFQDHFKVKPNFTLDFGLRWQYLGQMFSAQDNISSFFSSRYNPAACSAAAFSGGLVDPTKCNVLNGIVTPKSSGVTRSLKDDHYRDFEPRVGFSWDPFSSHKFVVRSGVGIYHGRDAFSQNSSSGRQPPFDTIPQLNNITFSQLAPGRLSPFNPNTPQPPVNMQVLDPIYQNPSSYQYSLGVQYELMRETTLEVNYVGSRQVHTGVNRNINQIPAPYRLAVAQGSIDPNSVRPYLGYSIINVNDRMGTSRYNSLQAYLNRQLHHGLALQIAYTFSRSITNTLNRDTEGGASPIMDAYNADADKALASSDQKHNLTLAYNWQIPFFSQAPSILKHTLGGWQMNGITTFRTGLPINICENRDRAGLGQSAGSLCQRPNLIGDPFLDKSTRTIDRFFNTAAFGTPANGTFGNAGRNILRGPGVNNWDFSLFKEMKTPWLGKSGGGLLSESSKLQFRGEFFNLFNHAQYNAPSRNHGTGSFGKVTSARDPRQVQLGLRLVF